MTMYFTLIICIQGYLQQIGLAVITYINIEFHAQYEL